MANIQRKFNLMKGKESLLRFAFNYCLDNEIDLSQVSGLTPEDFRQSH
jgi:hypothetical protein